MNVEDQIIQRYREAIAAPGKVEPWESLSDEDKDLWRNRWDTVNKLGETHAR